MTRHEAQSTGEPRPHWPAGIRPISVDGLDLLGVGDDGRLYWDGRPIEVSRGVVLSRAQKVFAWTVSGSAIVAALAGVAQAVAAIHAWKGVYALEIPR